MPLLTFDDKTKQGLQALSTLNAEQMKVSIGVGVHLAVDGTGRGLKGASAAVCDAAWSVCRAVVAAAAAGCTPQDIAASVAACGTSAAAADDIKTAYDARSGDIAAAIDAAAAATAPHQYSALRWRLDATIAARSAAQFIEPAVLFSLVTNKSNSDSSHNEENSKIFQADPTTLARVAAKLEEAAAEIKQSSTRRVMRNIK
eukprot:TRINITY_DN1638_c0_g1_i2.p1 TRINITY_DN1638_c0_g1~~TRINITY_DN1638_c0_g1_i2.p1  ORF type:complete len:201 (-),score=39.98 TRINITY_DN1638_c0_g1_i2:39-641(-)